MATIPLVPLPVSRSVDRRSGLDGALALVVRALLWPVRMARARRELARLGALSDRELRDIGLMRHDLRSATALPLEEDPTHFLASVVRERRRAERASAFRRP